MNRSDIAELVTRHEGVRYKVYDDTKGHPTIGIGFNLDREGARQRLAAVNAKFDRVILGQDLLTEAQVQALFSLDLNDAILDAIQLVRNFNDHPNMVQAVIVDMIFNLGATGFAAFTETRKALEAKDYCTTVAEMTRSKWFTDVPARAKEDIALVMEYCAA
jgi:GH24 family phage-related lysozyme (muramidase)